MCDLDSPATSGWRFKGLKMCCCSVREKENHSDMFFLCGFETITTEFKQTHPAPKQPPQHTHTHRQHAHTHHIHTCVHITFTRRHTHHIRTHHKLAPHSHAHTNTACTHHTHTNSHTHAHIHARTFHITAQRSYTTDTLSLTCGWY